MIKAMWCGAFVALMSLTATATAQQSPNAKPAERPARSADTIADANAYWSRHARDGFMSKEDAMKWKGPDGKAPDASRLRADTQGRISQKQWNAWATGAGDLGDKK